MPYSNALRTPGGSEQIATDTVGADKFQRVKWVIGDEGVAIAVPGDAANGVDVDVTRLPALPAGTNNIGDVDVLTLPALPAGANAIGTVDTELPAAAALADGAANATTPRVGSDGMLYNGATWDRERANEEGTALASAARTVQTVSPTFVNYSSRGILAALNVTVAGTGNLTLDIGPILTGINPLKYYGGSALVATTGRTGVMLYPGATAPMDNSSPTGGHIVHHAAALSRQFFLRVSPTDTSSWTYSVVYTLIR